MSELVEAERSVVAHMLANPDVIGEVLGTLLATGQFVDSGYRALYGQIADAWYDDGPTDAVSIGVRSSKLLSQHWGCSEEAAVEKVKLLPSTATGDPLAHAGLVVRDHGYRELLALGGRVQQEVTARVAEPCLIAGAMAQAATNIAIGSLNDRDVVSFGDLGREFVGDQREAMQAERAGIDLGAKFGLGFIDNYTRSLLPGELFFLASEPGAGKSTVAWKAGMNFGERQMKRPAEDRVGCLILSMEMGRRPSSIRLAQGLARVDGGKFRDGSNTDDELATVVREWGARKELPLFFNFTSTLRASQMKALVAEAIRKWNVGVVVLDHFRYFDMDRRYDSKLEEDEDKARFLKQQLAKDLNIAVVCLAHTTKSVGEDGRPRLEHLRGSGQIAAEADFVAMIHRPFKHASKLEIEAGDVLSTDAEFIYAKSRHGLETTVAFHLDAATLAVW